MIHASITRMQISIHVTFRLDEMINQRTTFEYLTLFSISLKISRIVRNVVVISNTSVFHTEIIRKIHFFIVQLSNKLKTQKSNMIANAQSIMSAYCIETSKKIKIKKFSFHESTTSVLFSWSLQISKSSLQFDESLDESWIQINSTNCWRNESRTRKLHWILQFQISHFVSRFYNSYELIVISKQKNWKKYRSLISSYIEFVFVQTWNRTMRNNIDLSQTKNDDIRLSFKKISRSICTNVQSSQMIVFLNEVLHLY